MRTTKNRFLMAAAMLAVISGNRAWAVCGTVNLVSSHTCAITADENSVIIAGSPNTATVNVQPETHITSDTGTIGTSETPIKTMNYTSTATYSAALNANLGGVVVNINNLNIGGSNSAAGLLTIGENSNIVNTLTFALCGVCGSTSITAPALTLGAGAGINTLVNSAGGAISITGGTGGTLTLSGSSSINLKSGTMGSSENLLETLNAGVGEVSIAGDFNTYVNTLNLTGTSTVTFNSGLKSTINNIRDESGTGVVALSQPVLGTIGTDTNAVGTLNVMGVGTVSGAAYLSNLNLLTENGGLDFNGAATIGTLAFLTSSGTVRLNATSDVSTVTTGTKNTGTLLILGNTTVLETVGSSSLSLGSIQLSAEGELTVEGDFYTNQLTNSSTANVGGTGSINSIGSVDYNTVAGVTNLNATGAGSTNSITTISVTKSGYTGVTTLAAGDLNTVGTVVTSGFGTDGSGSGLTFLGTGSVTGTIGTTSDYLGTLTAGAGNVNVAGLSYIATLSLNGTNTVTLADITGNNIISTVSYGSNGTALISATTGSNKIASVTSSGSTGSAGMGTLTFSGTGTISGTVGTSSAFLGTLNAGAANVSIAGSAYMSNLVFNGTNTVALNGTAGNAINSLSYGAHNATTTIANASSNTNTIGSITSTSAGTLTFSGAGTVTGAIGTGTSAMLSIVNTNGGAVLLGSASGDAYITNLNIEGTGAVTTGTATSISNITSVTYSAAGALNLNGTSTNALNVVGTLAYGAHNAATTVASGGTNISTITATNAGTLTFSGSGTVTGAIGTGTSAMLSIVNTNDGAVLLGSTSGDAYITNLNIKGTGTVTIGTATSISNITSVTYSAAGTLNLQGTSTNALNVIGTLAYGDNSATTNVSDGATTIGAVTAASSGTLNFLGAGTVTGSIGSGGSLSTLNAGIGSVSLGTASNSVFNVKTLNVSGINTVTTGTNSTTSTISSLNYNAAGSLVLNGSSSNYVANIDYGSVGGSITMSANGTNTIDVVTTSGGTGASGLGDITFLGSGTVSGIGTSSQFLGVLNAGLGAVSVGDSAYLSTLNLTGSSSVQFNGAGGNTVNILNYNATNANFSIASGTIASIGYTDSNISSGTLQLAGSVTVNGAIGSDEVPFGTLILDGENSSYASLNNDVYVSALNMTGSGIMSVGSSNAVNVLGSVTNSGNGGVLILNSTLTNSITGVLEYKTGSNSTRFAAGASTNSINSVYQVLSTGAGTGSGGGLLIFNGAGSVGAGGIGTTSDFLGILQAGYGGDLTVTGSAYLSNLQFIDSNTVRLNSTAGNTINTVSYASFLGSLIVAEGSGTNTIGGTTNNNNAGILTFLGSGSVTGNVGSEGNFLRTLNAGATSSTVSLSGDSIYLSKLNMQGVGAVNVTGKNFIAGLLDYHNYAGIITIGADTTNTINAVTLTNAGLGSEGVGTLTFLGAGSITNGVGDSVNGYLGTLKVGGGGEVSVGGSAYISNLIFSGANTMQLNGTGGNAINVLDYLTYDGTTTVADSSDGCSNTIGTVTASNVGTLTFSGAGSVSTIGQEGGGANLATLNAGAGIVDVSGSVYLNTLNLNGLNTVSFNGTLENTLGTLNYNSTDANFTIAFGTITSVTNVKNNLGTLAFIGSVSITNGLGTAENYFGTLSSGSSVSRIGGSAYLSHLNFKGVSAMSFLGTTGNVIDNVSYGNFDSWLSMVNNDTNVNKIGTVSVTKNGVGTLMFLGSGTVTGTIGSTDGSLSLGVLYAGAVGSSVSLNKNAYVNSLIFSGTGSVELSDASTINTVDFNSKSGSLIISRGKTLSGNIISQGSSSGNGGIGNVIFSSGGSIIGNVGSSENHLLTLDVGGGNVSISGTVGSDSIRLGLSKLTLTNSSILNLQNTVINLNTISENVITPNQYYGFIDYANGPLIVDSSTTVVINAHGLVSDGARLTVVRGESGNGGVGVAGSISTVNNTGYNIAFSQDTTYLDSLVLIASLGCNNNIILKNGVDCLVGGNYASNITTSDGTGVVTFGTGDFTLTGEIGDNTHSMAEVDTSSLNTSWSETVIGNLYATVLNINGTGTLTAGSNGISEIATVNYFSPGTVVLNSSTTNEVTTLVDFKGQNGTIQLDTVSTNTLNTIASTGLGSGAGFGTGTVSMKNGGTIQGNVGSKNNYISTLVAGLTGTLNLGNVYLDNLNIIGPGIVSMSGITNNIGNLTYSGTKDNGNTYLSGTSENHITGTLEFANLGRTVQITDGSTSNSLNKVLSTGAGSNGTDTLFFTKSVTVNGTLGAFNNTSKQIDYIANLSAGANGTTLSLKGDAYVGTLLISGSGIVNSGGTNTTNHYQNISFINNSTGAVNLSSTSSNIVSGTLAYNNNGGVVTVSAGTINSINAVTSTGSAKNATGTLTFLGNGQVTTTTGNMTDYFGTLNAGAIGSTVTLGGASYLNALNFSGTGTVALEADSTIKTLGFTHSGNLQIASDATLTANITTSGTGTGSGGIGGVLFKGSGTLIGNAGNKTNHLAVLDMTAGNAQISGTIGADSILLGLNTLSLVGNVGTDLTHSMITIQANNDNAYGKLVNTSPSALTTVDNTTAIVIDVGGYISTGASFKIISTEKNDGFHNIAPVTVHGSSNLVFVQDKTNTTDLVLIATRPEVSGGNVGGMLNLSNINPDGNLAEFLFYADQQQAPVASKLINQLNNQLVTQSSVQAMHTVHQVANRPVHDRNTMIGANMQHDPQGVSAGEQFYPFEMSFLDGSEMWAKGFSTIEKQKDKLGVSGYQNKITGAVLAIDGRYNQNVQLGIAGSYAISNIKINDGVSTVDMKNYKVTVYGLRHFDTNYYMTANVSMALNDYYGVRGIILPGISAQLAESKYKGNEYSADLSVGYPMKHKYWHIIPQASAYYRHINIDSYKETNAADMNLTVNGQHYDFLGGRAGVVLSRVYKTHSRRQWIPEMRLDYQHDFVTQSQDSRSLFTGGGASFETQGLAIYRNTVGLGLGVELLLPKRWAIGLDYHLTIKPSYSAESLVLTGKIPF